MGVSNRLFFFLTFVVYIVVISNINNGVEASHRIYAKFQTFPAEKVDPTNKPVYHFQPPKHWMNDPNGPMYFNGIYHLFYQYNPHGSVWGNIIWAHSVSRDLVNWEAVEPAIKPSKSFDFNGTWSGSATILPGNKPIILYTGVVENQQQLQAYALPANTSDPYLRKWIVPDRYNPIIHPTGVNGSAFRDPTTAWKGTDGLWRILIGGRRKHRGMAHLYKSRDFFRWRKAKKPLHSKAMTGMWECPDFFPVSLTGKTGLDTLYIEKGVKYVLKNSLDVTRYDYYTLGTYLVDKDRYIPDNTSEDGWRGLRYDYGNFYASKSFFDPKKNRRILWGWSNESDSKQDDINKGWAGLQTIPRSVWLDTNGRQLVQWPVEEIETLRGKKVTLNNQELKLGQNVEVQGITAAQADVDVTFSFPSLDKAEPFDPKLSHLDAEHLCGQKGSRVQGGLGPFGLLTLASQKLEEFTPVFFRIFKKPDKHVVLMCSDASTSSLKTNSEMFKPSFAGFMDVDLSDKKLSLRSLIDHSVVESFGAGGRTCITSRVYPTLAITNNAHLFLFNNGTETIKVEKLDVWNMNKPKMNGA